jgi:hypothetical protein
MAALFRRFGRDKQHDKDKDAAIRSSTSSTSREPEGKVRAV